MDNFHGIIIKESLEYTSVLNKISILFTKIEKVTENHKTPWLNQWTLYSVEIPETKADKIALKISRSLDEGHSWYADFKNNLYHYIIFRNKVFYINRKNKKQYDKAKKYGLSLGIPDYQLDWSTSQKN